jgi:putative Mg2+ transporter-C (MgtC) family protein
MADLLLFVFYVAAALGMGVTLGLERQFRGHPAGLRTNALVCVGAAMFVSLSRLMDVGSNPHLDPTRVASYVVSGIGFLGGGVILREGFNVRGMNTAATLWCSAAVGVLCGAGFVAYALVGTATVLTIHLGLRPLARWVDARRKTAPDVEMAYRLRVLCGEKVQGVIRAVLLRHVNAHPQMTVQGISAQDGEGPGRAVVEADIFSVVRNDRAMEDLVRRLDIEPGVTAVSWDKRQ